ncbi:MAG: hypothetical protein JW820_03295 [Spirochaetales bacterium]|nr:hypothetical protein [Spirochaetales bacterium]
MTVPGNLLLLGEYAVLEEGGLGVCLGLERRVVVRSEPARQLEIEGSWGRGAVRWSERAPEASPLFREVVRSCRRYLAAAGRFPIGPGPSAASDGPAARLRVDSSAFFLSPERKSGFGSSAAVAVGLAFSLLVLAGLDAAAATAAAPQLALEAHRAAHGGGSGYDVLTSAHGGMGLFTGGAAPRWQALALLWLPPLYLLQGPRSVSSAEAVKRYREWKREHPGEARRFLRRSNAAVEEFVNAGSWTQAEASFLRAREQGLRLGERIGVPAALAPPPGLRGVPFKAVGAGDELGVVALPHGREGAALAAGLERLVPAEEGVAWQG